MGEYARQDILSRFGVDIGDSREPIQNKPAKRYGCSCGRVFISPQAKEQHQKDTGHVNKGGKMTLSDDELVELGKSKGGLHPWGVGTTKADYLRAVRAVLDSVSQHSGEPYGYVYTVQEAPTVGDERKVTRTVFTRTKPPCSATPLYTATVEGGDTKRLDWMETMGSDRVVNLGTTWYARVGYGQPHRRYKDLRTAVDAAMAAQKENK